MGCHVGSVGIGILCGKALGCLTLTCLAQTMYLDMSSKQLLYEALMHIINCLFAAYSLVLWEQTIHSSPFVLHTLLVDKVQVTTKQQLLKFMIVLLAFFYLVRSFQRPNVFFCCCILLFLSLDYSFSFFPSFRSFVL